MQEKIMEQASVPGERLYYEDSHMQEFHAVVVSCEEDTRGYRIVLDRTAFFPEGGGQSGDIGALWVMTARTGEAPCRENIGRSAGNPAECSQWTDPIRVLDTQEKDGVIFHITDRPAAAGTCVTGKLDFEERFVRMQQHSGEHIISGIVNRLYGYDNVGFHLGAEITTLDFNGELIPEQVGEVEKLANQAVFADLPVQVSYPSGAELRTLPYRSKIEIEGQVRIVTIPGIDTCACCAPHVGRTGEIGLIKIVSCEKHRGGCRMVMLCGMRALEDYNRKQRSVAEISVALSAKPEEISKAVLHQKEQMQKMREHLNRLQAVYLEGRLDEIAEGQERVCLFVEGFDNIAVRNFVNGAVGRCSGICAAFIGTDESGYSYILGSRNADVRGFAKKLNAQFGGRGGGKPEMVQGSLCGKQEEIRRFCETADIAWE